MNWGLGPCAMNSCTPCACPASLIYDPSGQGSLTRLGRAALARCRGRRRELRRELLLRQQPQESSIRILRALLGCNAPTSPNVTLIFPKFGKFRKRDPWSEPSVQNAKAKQQGVNGFNGRESMSLKDIRTVQRTIMIILVITLTIKTINRIHSNSHIQ